MDLKSIQSPDSVVDPDQFASRRLRTQWQMVRHELWKNKGAMLSLVVLCGVLVLGILAPVISPYDPIEIDSDARIQNGPRISKSRDNPWEWTIEAGITTANPSPGTSNILSPDSDFTALIPSGMVGVYSETQRIAEGKDSRASETWTATCYYTS